MTDNLLPLFGFVALASQWLSNNELIPQIVELLSPTHSPDLHNTVAELIKAIIALSAPSPAGMGPNQEGYGYGAPGAFGGQEQPVGVQNKLVRELASEPIVRRMVSFMLDSAHSSQLTRRLSEAADEQSSEDSAKRRKPSEFARQSGLPALSTLNEDSAIDDDEDGDDADPQPLNPSMTPAFEPRFDSHRDSTATVRPTNFFPPVRAPECPISPETSTSSLITGIGIFIELIRKNNSDYFEQHLFHALRAHLLQRQQEIRDKKAQARSEGTAEESMDDEDEEMEGMEEAMAEMTDKLGIVHLGPMLMVLCERLSEFQDLIHRPRSSEAQISTTLGPIRALSFERYRITELYAELLHCSNMALLNRAPGDGPQYSSDGILQGGIQGLQILARTLQPGELDDSPEASAPTEAMETTPAANSTDDQSSSNPAGRHERQVSSLGEGENSFDSADAEMKDGTASDPFSDEASGPQEAAAEAAGDNSNKVDEEDARSIRSALSTMSLADLTTPHPSGPPSPISDTKEYVVGDLLKKKFLDCGIIPTILSLFFEFPWNNFLHNVVYDILQQCFNGRMDAGFNRRLTLAVFQDGQLPAKILDGQTRNIESMAQPRRIRLGFMGHMNLIAEETVKLIERYPRDIGEPVSSCIPQPDWDQFVNESLKENREKESAPLAGGRPMPNQFGFPPNVKDDGAGEGGSLGVLNQGGGSEAFANYLSSQMGGNSSDDDDSDEESGWIAQDSCHTGFDDAFEPSRGGSITATTQDDDDEWGAFAGPSQGMSLVSNTTFDFQSSASQPLTAADWAASAFDRSGSPEDGFGGTSGQYFGGDGQSPSNAAFAGDDEEVASPGEEQTPFVDLSDAASYRQAQIMAAARQQPRRSSSSDGSSSSSSGAPPTASRHRRTSSSAGSTDLSAAQAVGKDEPYGPGVPADVEVKDGMIERTLEDGSTVKVPLDDVALAQAATSESESAVADEESGQVEAAGSAEAAPEAAPAAPPAAESQSGEAAKADEAKTSAAAEEQHVVVEGDDGTGSEFEAGTPEVEQEEFGA